MKKLKDNQLITQNGHIYTEDEKEQFFDEYVSFGNNFHAIIKKEHIEKVMKIEGL